MGERKVDLGRVKAILLDLHETITEEHESLKSLTRKVSKNAGLDLGEVTDDEMEIALEKVNEWLVPYQMENDVDLTFGSEIEHWTEANRIMYKALGFEGLSDKTLHHIERLWKEALDTWELLRPETVPTLLELKSRGYDLGICTRRDDDPTKLLEKWGILHLLSTVQWTSVPGYSKPNPYTLILAAEDIGVNPLRCAFVGNRVDADIEAAQRAGMIPILTTWADPEEARKAPEGTIVIGEVSELLDLFSH